MRRLIDFLPRTTAAPRSGRASTTRATAIDDSLDTLIPDNAEQPYDMKELIRRSWTRAISSKSSRAVRGNIITGFGRIEGQTVGVVANQPMVLAGVLDIDASRKAARFVRFCDASKSRSSPSSTCRASCPAPRRNTAAHQARREAAVRLCRSHRAEVTVITRKAYGGAYDVMAQSTCAAT
jgi:propionyl-CoA carboxylase beta chain